MNVGQGVLEAMAARGDSPATDELYLSITTGTSGALYIYRSDSNTVTVVPSPEAAPDPVVEASVEPIVTRFGEPPADLQAAVRAHFPESEWVNACEISYHESGWDPLALNDTVTTRGACGTRYWLASAGVWADTEFSCGYFQINVCVYGGSRDRWADADFAARKARELYDGRGGKWTDWVISAGKLGLPV